MAKFLEYEFSKSELANDVYYPAGHAEIETDQTLIRRGFAKLLNGEIAIPMAVKEFPIDPAALHEQEELRKLLIEWLGGSRAVQVQEK